MAFTNPQLIKVAETLILSSGKYKLPYQDWINLPESQKKFNNFPIQFSQKYQILNEMKITTVQQQGFTVNSEEKPSNHELEGAVENFAQATAADRTAFTQLTDTDATLNEYLSLFSAQNSDLHNQMALLELKIQQMNVEQQPQH